MTPLYEDNHIIIVNKEAGEIVQGDKTGDATLADAVKQYLKDKYAKPGEVFIGIPHRLDRPTSGIVVFARTGKALSRLTEMFRTNAIKKTYWAITEQEPSPTQATLTHWLIRNEKQNKSYAYLQEKPQSKQALLDYRLLCSSEHYYLVEILLHTGRHHQIRCQLAAIGCTIKGDLKYGARRSNRDGSISLHARSISFEHPVSHKPINVTAPVPNDKLWLAFQKMVNS